MMTMSYWPMASFSQAMCSCFMVKLAPGQTVIRFLALCSVISRVMWPTPEDSSGSTVTWDTSTPASLAAFFRMVPKESAPTRPTMVTSAPRRAHCTAWLAPLPPGAVWNFMPTTVSPSLGARLVEAIRSIIKLPTTRILGFFSIRNAPFYCLQWAPRVFCYRRPICFLMYCSQARMLSTSPMAFLSSLARSLLRAKVDMGTAYLF